MTSKDIPPAGTVGRVGKLAVGVIQLAFAYALVVNAKNIVGGLPRAPDDWIVFLWALWLVPPVVNLGLIRERAWGSRPLWWTVGAIAVVAIVNRVATGSIWAPATAVALLAVAISVFAYAGTCHLLSAIIGFPGCEMRALAYLTARARHDGTPFAPCRGAWTRLDRWELRLRERGLR